VPVLLSQPQSVTANYWYWTILQGHKAVNNLARVHGPTTSQTRFDLFVASPPSNPRRATSLYYTVSRKTSHLRLAITLTHINGFWYFLAEMLPIKYYATSNNLCFCITWQNAETRKSHISLNRIVLHAQCTCALSSWNKKLSSVMCLIASNICWGSKISH